MLLSSNIRPVRVNTRDELLEILLNKKDNYSKLKFIRTKKPEYTLESLKNIYVCVTNYFGFSNMILEDDAKFETPGYDYRALFYRIFINKDSLYADTNYEFIPTQTDDFYFVDDEYTHKHYLRDKEILFNSILGDFENYYSQVFDIVNSDFLEKT